MSVQLGRWNFEGEPSPEGYIKNASALLSRYGPDSEGSYSKAGMEILYRAFQTTKEARREPQPHVSATGAVIMWDGRLDNRAELIDELRSSLAINSTDVSVVSEAYEHWGARCFAKLIGDWALSIWHPADRYLVLARDPIGPRHLYYAIDNKQITWCTVLDPLVLLEGTTPRICEEYVAGWLSMYPAVHLTPYVGIHAVPPSSCVFVRPGKHSTRQYWDFNPSTRILYRTDAEYEEHFRTVFAKAVQRRLRSDTPVLAELSGGRDSASIVCMADIIIARGEAETPRLDTVSYYDNSEPNWNEVPYFTKVEEKRGRTGWHIDINSQDSEMTLVGPLQLPYCLAPTNIRNSHAFEQVRMCLQSQGNRIVLSGIGGDEVMGGVPIPTAALQDLLMTARFGMLAHQLKAWALQRRKPWFHLVLEAARGFFPPALVGVPKHIRPARWLKSSFVSRQRAALTGYPHRINLFGPLASFQDNLSTLNGLRRQLSTKLLSGDCIYEKSYPYLDRSLLEFMYAIPREQSVRPTQRRSLMRRALAGIVPVEILNRKRKASAFRAPLVRLSTDWTSLVQMTEHMISSSLGIVDCKHFLSALQNARRGEELYWLPLIRAIHIENWFRNLLRLGVVNFETGEKQTFTQASAHE